MMQAQVTKQTMMQAEGHPASGRTIGVFAVVAVATVAANVLMAMGWSHLLSGAAWMAAPETWLRLTWMLGFGLLLASNNGLALLLVWGWARRVQQQSEMRRLVRWARQDVSPRLTLAFPFVALPVAVLLAPALLLLV